MLHSSKVTLGFLAALTASPVAIQAQDSPTSRLSIPFTLPVVDLKSYANQALPQQLHNESYGRTCIEAERACTKIPEFRGLKIYSRMECIDVTPRIKCQIDERVAREGELRLFGQGTVLTVEQDIYATATVKGRGEIGKNIRQTVRAKAGITATAKFSVAPDWTPKIDPQLSYRWIQRPEFRLFNLFPITLGSTLGPPLDKALRDFEAELPAQLARLELRDELETLWSDIQKPHSLGNLDGVEAFLHLRPYGLGLTGPVFDNANLTARLDMGLRASVTDTPRGPAKTRLPKNRPLPAASTSLVVPVRVKVSSLNRLVSSQLPKELTLNQQTPAKAVIHEAALQIAGDLLVANLRLDASLAGLSVSDQAIQVRAKVALVPGQQAILIKDIDLTASSVGGFTGFARAALIELLQLFLQDTVTVSLKDETEKFQRALTLALNRDIVPGLRLSGAGSVAIESVSLLGAANAIEVVLASIGDVQITGFDPMRK
ncbi:MAG: DUF4403 family protein [Paracoccaceae bacterium]